MTRPSFLWRMWPLRPAREPALSGPLQLLLARLASIELSDVKVKHAFPEWARFAAWRRSLFTKALFQIEEPSGRTYWRFCYAKQSPLDVCMVRLQQVEQAYPEFCGSLAEVVDLMWDHAFEVHWIQRAYTSDGRWDPSWPCSVLLDSVFSSGKLLVANGKWLQVHDLIASYGGVPAGPLEDQTEKPSDTLVFEDDLYSLNPWLAEFLHETGHASENSGKASKMAPKVGKPFGLSAHGPSHRDEIDAEVVMDALLAKRVDMDLVGPAPHPCFQTILRGGEWLKATTGLDFDAVRGQVCDPLAEQWCVDARLWKSFTMSIATHGESLFLTLCNAWCARMAWLYETSLCEGRDFVFTKEVCSDFAEDPEVEIAFQAGPEALQKRVRQIRELAPRFAA